MVRCIPLGRTTGIREETNESTSTRVFCFSVWFLVYFFADVIARFFLALFAGLIRGWLSLCWLRRRRHALIGGLQLDMNVCLMNPSTTITPPPIAPVPFLYFLVSYTTLLLPLSSFLNRLIHLLGFGVSCLST